MASNKVQFTGTVIKADRGINKSKVVLEVSEKDINKIPLGGVIVDMEQSQQELFEDGEDDADGEE